MNFLSLNNLKSSWSILLKDKLKLEKKKKRQTYGLYEKETYVLKLYSKYDVGSIV